MNKKITKLPFIGNFLGGHLLGSIDISYKDIVAKLGKPNMPNDGYKTDAEWLVITEKGHANIYNYKDGRNYLGEDGLKIVDITDWHIGGENPEVVEIVINYLSNE